MILSGQLWEILAQINEQVQDRLDRTIRELAAAEAVTEDLKAADPMAWVGAMNNIRSRAEEIVLQELIWEEKQNERSGRTVVRQPGTQRV